VLQQMAGAEDFGPEPGASAEAVAEAVQRWKLWWNAKQEAAAAQLLTDARQLLGRNRTAARRRLQEIVNRYKGTNAAREAQQLLGN
jgi:hypothetical protein